MRSRPPGTTLEVAQRDRRMSETPEGDADMDRTTQLLAAFDAGRITRRQMLQALGLAAVAVPASLIGQQPPAAGGRAAGAGGGGRGGGAPRVPVPRPFADTGWKTVWLDKL